MSSYLGSTPVRSAPAGIGSPAMQAAQLQRWHYGPERPGGETSRPAAVQEFTLRHLKTAAEIERILYLRQAIDLSVHTRAPANFESLEKKETSAASSAPSSCAGTS